jgi:hypothetical protein
MNFGDNDKAIFGAGNDLEIYHDGSNSFIRDGGTGNLVIRGTNLNLQKDGGESYITMVADGAVTAFYDNSAKLATTATGIDVTGTATMDGLIVGSPVFSTGVIRAKQASDASRNRGILLEAQADDSVLAIGYNNGKFSLNPTYTSNGSFKPLSVFTSNLERFSVATNGDISFYEDTGTTAKLTWSAANESLTFGTNLAITTNEIDVATGDLTLDVAGDIILDADGGDVSFRDAGVEYGRITNNATNLQIYSAVQDVDIQFKGNDGGSAITALTLDMSAAGVATFNSNVILPDNSYLLFGDTTSGIQGNSSSDFIKFYTANTERFLIAGNGDISFYEDTGTTPKFVWDASAEALGIGTTTVTTTIDVNASPATGSGASNTNTIGAAFASLHGNTSGNDQAFAIRTTGSQLNGISGSAFASQVYAPANNNALEVFTGGATPLVFGTSATERLRIDSSGNVGIGNTIFTSARVTAPHLVVGSGSASPGLTLYGAANSQGSINFADSTSGTDSYDGGIVYAFGSGSPFMTFHVNGGAEAMRIDSSGNVGIGTTSPSSYNAVADNLVIGTTSGSNGLTIVAGTGNDGSIHFADGTSGADAYRGQIYYSHAGNYMVFSTNASEAMRIDSTKAATFSGAINQSLPAAANIQSQHSTGTTTGSNYHKISNTGGTLIWGVESSAGGSLLVGASAYEAIIGTQTSDNLVFGTDNTKRMTLDASGNVGINVTPSAWAAPTGGSVIEMVNGASFASRSDQPGIYALLNAYHNGANWIYKATAAASQYFQNAGVHSWSTAPSGTAGNTISWSESMRIDSSGNLLVGRTSTITFSTNTTDGIVLSPSRIDISAASLCRISQLRDSTGTYDRFYNGASIVGSITGTTSATAYNTSSDQRLKENIADADDAGSKVDAIQVRQFDWKIDGSHQDYGMVAQELMTVAPEAVHQPEDPEDMMGVDYSKLVPMLIKEIQSLRNRVATLEGN